MHAGASVEDFSHPRIKHGLHVFLGNDATHIDGHVAAAKFSGGVDQSRHQHQMRVAHHGAGQHISVFIACANGE